MKVTIGAIAAAARMPRSLKLLDRSFSAKAVMPADSSFAELKARYQSCMFRLGVLMLIVALPLSLVFWLVLRPLSAWHGARVSPAETPFALLIEAYWVLPAFLLGLVGGGMAAMWTARRLLGNRYGEFLAYWSLWSGMDPIKANAMAFQVCTLAGAGLIVLGLVVSA